MYTKEELRIETLKIALSGAITTKLFKEFYQKDIPPEQLILLANKDKLANISNIDISIKALTEKGIGYICLWEDEYPINLRNIVDPPIVIFYKGNKALLDNLKLLSFVGSRRMSSYGKKVVNEFVKDFKPFGYTIVSGMAAGIDSIAHKAALGNDIPTIAVLASSVDVPSPTYNTELYNDILNSGGLILSEHFPGSEIRKGFFPRRNRIIAGLSKGVLVVEAHSKSGALITANLAFGYARPVFVVPDNIYSKYSSGSNQLITDNKARLVQSYKDILYDFPEERLSLRKKEDIKLNKIESFIYQSLKDGSKSVETLVNCLNLDISVIISSCSIMEINGFLSKNERGEYFLL